MALGRGLGAILEEVGQAYDNEVSEASADQIREIDVNTISANPYQPRKTFEQEALRELSESIKRHGLLQPIVVIKKDDGFLLVAGERRLRAHKLAGLDRIKAVIADVNIDDAKLRELALIENIQREDLNAMELAHSYDELIKVYEITHDELSEVVNKSRSQITNTLRLLSLSTYVQNKLIDGAISQGHAKILVGFEEEDQQLLVDTIIGQKLSVRESEVLAKNKKNKDQVEVAPEKKFSFIENYKSSLKETLPFSFKVKNNSLEINFKNDNEIEKFLKMLQK
ncbi:ParB/RepB/Spo0J family partition protein [bacterium]|nr:ParB/RepB/Spo0J family partition protein [bacterium]MBU1957925.1 ParB/RepB/Spo0J family partition protein [bacterium]